MAGETSYVVVRNAKPRMLPRWLRVWLGEQYLTIAESVPSFTHAFQDARVFPTHAWADTYVHDQAGRVRNGMQGCVVRAVSLPHTIPLEG